MYALYHVDGHYCVLILLYDGAHVILESSSQRSLDFTKKCCDILGKYFSTVNHLLRVEIIRFLLEKRF